MTPKGTFNVSLPSGHGKGFVTSFKTHSQNPNQTIGVARGLFGPLPAGGSFLPLFHLFESQSAFACRHERRYVRHDLQMAERSHDT